MSKRKKRRQTDNSLISVFGGKRYLLGGESSSGFNNHPKHRGSVIKAGPYRVFAGASRDLRGTDLEKVDLILPLNQEIHFLQPGQRIEILSFPWDDYAPPPFNFAEFLEEVFIPLLQEGRRPLIYCTGGHGRTGTFIAGLIAMVETEIETPDPIAAVRSRHCFRAVETKEQAEAVFALRGQSLPKQYQDMLKFDLPSLFRDGAKGSYIVYDDDKFPL